MQEIRLIQDRSHERKCTLVRLATEANIYKAYKKIRRAAFVAVRQIQQGCRNQREAFITTQKFLRLIVLLRKRRPIIAKLKAQAHFYAVNHRNIKKVKRVNKFLWIWG